MNYKPTAWIVDDELELAQVYSDFLEPSFKTKVFGSAKAALAAFDSSKEPPSVLVSDIRMPQQDGVSFIEELRKRDINTPTILISGYSEKQHLIRACRLNVSGFLEKPCDPGELEALALSALKVAHDLKLRNELVRLYRLREEQTTKLATRYIARYIRAERALQDAKHPILTDANQRAQFLENLREENLLSRTLEDIDLKIKELSEQVPANPMRGTKIN